jgi:hypothetical protein
MRPQTTPLSTQIKAFAGINPGLLAFAVAPLQADTKKRILLNALGDVCQTLWGDASSTDSIQALNTLRPLAAGYASPRDWAQLEQAAKSPRSFSSWSGLMVFLQFGAAPLGRILQKAYNVPEALRPAVEALAIAVAVIWRLEESALHNSMYKGLEKLLLQAYTLRGRRTIADPHLRAFTRRLRVIGQILCHRPGAHKSWSRWRHFNVLFAEVIHG